MAKVARPGEALEAQLLDEALAPDQPLVILLALAGQFVDERPATLVRNDVDHEGSRRLLVRDETNGNLRSFPYFDAWGGFREFHIARDKTARLEIVTAEERATRDVVTMQEKSRIQSCDMCGEPDVFGVRTQGRSRCGRCVSIDECWARHADPADADLARALVRYELAIEEHPSMRTVLAQLDGLSPWRIASEPFASPELGIYDKLRERTLLVEAMWRGALQPTATVEVPTTIEEHPWSEVRPSGGRFIAFVVRKDDIIVRANGEVVAERVA